MRGIVAKRLRKMAKLSTPKDKRFLEHLRNLKRNFNNLTHREKGALK